MPPIGRSHYGQNDQTLGTDPRDEPLRPALLHHGHRRRRPAVPLHRRSRYYGPRDGNNGVNLPASAVQYFNGYAAPNYLDTTAPTLTLTRANPITVAQNSPWTEPGFTVSDDVDCDLKDDVVITPSPFNTGTPGTFTLTYTVSDTAGNPATVTRTVIDTRNYTLESASDLHDFTGQWTPLPAHTEIQGTPDSDGHVMVPDPTPLGQQLFYRVRAYLPE